MSGPNAFLIRCALALLACVATGCEGGQCLQDKESGCAGDSESECNAIRGCNWEPVCAYSSCANRFDGTYRRSEAECRELAWCGWREEVDHAPCRELPDAGAIPRCRESEDEQACTDFSRRCQWADTCVNQMTDEGCTALEDSEQECNANGGCRWQTTPALH